MEVVLTSVGALTSAAVDVVVVAVRVDGNVSRWRVHAGWHLRDADRLMRLQTNA